MVYGTTFFVCLTFSYIIYIDMQKLVSGSGAGLLSADYRRKSIPWQIFGDKPFSFVIPADYDYDLVELKKTLSARARDKINGLFLQGTYNPYIRFQPFPPTHVNVNYLLDPRKLLESKELDPLYDEHKDGFAPGRADPMLFPKIAMFPFDPNSHPQPTEKGQNWWEVLEDFFMSD